MNWRIFAVAIAALVQADGAAEPLPHCGIGCAYAVLRHFGVDVSVATLEREMVKLDPEADLGRLTLPHLSRLIRTHGLHTRAVLADLRDLERIPTPAILLLDKGPDGTETTVGHVVLIHYVPTRDASRNVHR